MAVAKIVISWDYDPDIVSTKVQYKKASDTDFTTPTANNPTTDTSYNLYLEDGFYYDVMLTAKKDSICNCTAKPVLYKFLINSADNTTTTTSTTTSTTTTIYIPPVQKTFTDLASPYTLLYNSTNKNIYYTDPDEANGLLKFDPTTAQDKSDFSYVDAANISNLKLKAAVYDANNNAIYAHGDNSGGAIKVDCSTDTVSTTYTYGANSAFNRQNMFLINGVVYAYTLTGNKFYTINTADGTTGTFVPPDNGSFVNANLLDSGGSKIWLLQGGGTTARAVSFLNSDLSTIVDEVDAIATKVNSTGRVDVEPGWYDIVTNEIWFVSPGDNYIGVIDATTATLTHTIPIDTEGYSYAQLSAAYYSAGDDLYFTGNYVNTSSDFVNRTVLVDRTNHTISGVSDITFTKQFVFADSTGFSYVGVPGASSPTTGYDTDGEIKVYGETTTTTTTTTT